MSNSPDKIGPKIQRLAQMACELRAGKNFHITRLTTIKSLAEDPKLANRFVLHLAEKSEQVLQKSRRPQGMGKSSWEQGQKLAAEAITEMSKYVKRRPPISRMADCRDQHINLSNPQLHPHCALVHHEPECGN